MILPIVKIGNSRGLRLPKGVLDEYHMEKEVDMQPTKDGLLIRPKKAKARQNWSRQFQTMAARGEDKLLIPDAVDLDTKDWEW
jgi:antitoxin MazE